MAGSYQPAPPFFGYASSTWCCIYGTHGTCNGISLMGYGLLYSFAFELCASRFVPSQWETALLCNDVSHWLGVTLESALNCQSLSENMKGHRSTAFLTHWGRVTHICVSTLTIIGSDNGLSPGRRQAIILTNHGILLIGPLGTNFSEILIKIQTSSLKKMHLKMSSGKWRPLFSASMC